MLIKHDISVISQSYHKCFIGIKSFYTNIISYWMTRSALTHIKYMTDSYIMVLSTYKELP